MLAWTPPHLSVKASAPIPLPDGRFTHYSVHWANSSGQLALQRSRGVDLAVWIGDSCAQLSHAWHSNGRPCNNGHRLHPAWSSDDSLFAVQLDWSSVLLLRAGIWQIIEFAPTIDVDWAPSSTGLLFLRRPHIEIIDLSPRPVIPSICHRMLGEGLKMTVGLGHIAVIHAPCNLCLLRIVDGRLVVCARQSVVPVPPKCPPCPMLVRFSPCDRLVAIISSAPHQHCLSIFRVTSGSLLVAHDVPPESLDFPVHQRLHWTPSGDRLLVEHYRLGPKELINGVSGRRLLNTCLMTDIELTHVE